MEVSTFPGRQTGQVIEACQSMRAPCAPCFRQQPAPGNLRYLHQILFGNQFLLAHQYTSFPSSVFSLSFKGLKVRFLQKPGQSLFPEKLQRRGYSGYRRFVWQNSGYRMLRWYFSCSDLCCGAPTGLCKARRHWQALRRPQRQILPVIHLFCRKTNHLGARRDSEF